MNTYTSTRIKLKIDDLSNWIKDNAVTLYNGEIGVVVLSAGDVRIKVGDGTSRFLALPYVGDQQIINKVKKELQNYYTKSEINQISAQLSAQWMEDRSATYIRTWSMT